MITRTVDKQWGEIVWCWQKNKKGRGRKRVKLKTTPREKRKKIRSKYFPGDQVWGYFSYHFRDTPFRHVSLWHSRTPCPQVHERCLREGARVVKSCNVEVKNLPNILSKVFPVQKILLQSLFLMRSCSCWTWLVILPVSTLGTSLSVGRYGCWNWFRHGSDLKISVRTEKKKD